MTYEQSKVGFNTALAGLIVLIATKFGVDIPNGVAVAIVGLAGVVTAYFSPGWADKVGWKKYPAGITAGLVTILTWLLPAVGVNEFTQSDLVALTGLITLAVGLVTPAAEDPDLDRERVGI